MARRYPNVRLAVCWIWTSQFVWTKSVASLLRLRHPDGVDVQFFQGRGWSPAARHLHACERAIAWGADCLVILGADQVYGEDLLERLVARRREGYEVVAALVPTRGYLGWQDMKPFQPMAWRLKSQGLTPIQWRADCYAPIDPKDGAMQRIDFIGSGCILFDADHLLALQRPWFFETIDPVTQQRTACMDTKFCFRLRREAHAQVWVDTTIKITHVHDMPIDETFQDRFDDWMVAGQGDPTICDYGTPARMVKASTVEPRSALVDA